MRSKKPQDAKAAATHPDPLIDNALCQFAKHTGVDYQRSVRICLKPSNPAEKLKDHGYRGPFIGVFWIYQGTVYKSALPFYEGIPACGKVDSPEEHVRVWTRFQDSHAHLRGLDYAAVPRGRVLFDLRTFESLVYLAPELLNRPQKQLLIEAFQLDPKHTHFETDQHYTTDAETLANLFD